MIKRTEERICDRCQGHLYRDTGSWMGAEIAVLRHSTDTGSLLTEKLHFDLCSRCFAEWRTWLGC